jgi:hypothetical protein
MAQQRSTALVAAVTKLIDTSSPPSPPSLFSNPQPASRKSKLKTVHNDNLASLLQIDPSSQDFHLEMRFLINRPFATLHSHPSCQRASSHIYVGVSHLNCDTSTVRRTSIHISQGLGSFDRLTNGFNSHELSSQPFASFSTPHAKTKIHLAQGSVVLTGPRVATIATSSHHSPMQKFNSSIQIHAVINLSRTATNLFIHRPLLTSGVRIFSISASLLSCSA